MTVLLTAGVGLSERLTVLASTDETIPRWLLVGRRKLGRLSREDLHRVCP
jgi:hypothetical protein